jgi:hypothetical protein
MSLSRMLMMAAVAKLSYKSVVLADKPVGYWMLNETSGTTAYDSSGNGLNGTVESGVTIGQTQSIPAVKGSYYFNGSSGYVNVPASSLLCPLSQGTVEAWVYNETSTSSSGDWVSTGGNQGYRVRSENGYPDIVYASADQLTGTALLSTSGFDHVVITFGSNGAQIYVNGVLQTSGGAAYSQSAGTAALHIGADLSYSEYFQGYLSNVAIYNTVLSAARIQAHYNAGVG